MSNLKTSVTTLFLIVLCYGVPLNIPKNVVKGKKIIVTDTTKKINNALILRKNALYL
jgi:hypothetical protein